jgi:hypothetical protein
LHMPAQLTYAFYSFLRSCQLRQSFNAPRIY